MKNFILDDIYDENETIQYEKSLMFIKGYAIGKELHNTILALSLARKLHNNQYRKGGAPYVCHPLKVCSVLISYGVDDDVILAAALLHDVLEDCKEYFPKGGEEFITEYHLDPEILEIVKLLTKEKGLTEEELTVYFNRIKENPKAALIKLSDRLNNCSTMYRFSDERLRRYIDETDKFLIPMASYCKKFYPQYTNQFSILKNSIHTINRSMDAMLTRIETSKHEKN